MQGFNIVSTSCSKIHSILKVRNTWKINFWHCIYNCFNECLYVVISQKTLPPPEIKTNYLLLNIILYKKLAFWPLNSSSLLGCAKIFPKPHTESEKQMESNAISKILDYVIMFLRNSILSIKIKFQENIRALISLLQTMMPITQVNPVPFFILATLEADSEVTHSSVSKETA